EYLEIYRQQLRELLTNYGPIFEVWHDGANGGDGFYGAAREKRTIDRRTFYDWPTTWRLVRTLQPKAGIFSGVGPDIRWVGNESGYAGETNWATYAPVGEDGGAAAPGYVREKEGQSGHRQATHWLPAECDVSIRPGWFWHERENDRVKTPRALVELYDKSVGRGCNLLLNIPPDRRGQLYETDVASLKRFGELLQHTFTTNLAAWATLTASNVRGRNPAYDPRHLVENYRYGHPRANASARVWAHGYWATDDDVKTPELVIDFGTEQTFSVIRLRENIKLGQRVEGFAVDVWQNDAWREVVTGTSIGPSRLLRLDTPERTTKVRLRITQSPVAPALSDLGIFAEPSEARRSENGPPYSQA